MLSSSLPVVRRVLGILLGAAALILAFAVLVPALLGYQRYVITSGSMTGTYDRGSLVFDRVVPTTSLRAGDVITFRPPGHVGLVTHRIASVRTTAGQRVFTTKGDANRVADAWGAIALHDARQARVAFHLPYLGYGLATLSDRRVRMIVIGVPALLIALAALSGLWRDSAPAPQSRSTRPA
jgi:signal peptidase